MSIIVLPDGSRGIDEHGNVKVFDENGECLECGCEAPSCVHQLIPGTNQGFFLENFDFANCTPEPPGDGHCIECDLVIAGNAPFFIPEGHVAYTTWEISYNVAGGGLFTPAGTWRCVAQWDAAHNIINFAGTLSPATHPSLCNLAQGFAFGSIPRIRFTRVGIDLNTLWNTIGYYTWGAFYQKIECFDWNALLVQYGIALET